MAVNTLGLAGVVGHAVLGFNPRQQQPQDQDSPDALPRLITMSGRTEGAVLEAIKKVRVCETTPLISERSEIVRSSKFVAFRAFCLIQRPAGSSVVLKRIHSTVRPLPGAAIGA